VNGLIAQFIARVIRTGLGVFADFNTWTKSIFTMMGYIMKNKQIAIGIDT
jgi:Flp pilus assembly pilin Flp